MIMQKCADLLGSQLFAQLCDHCFILRYGAACRALCIQKAACFQFLQRTLHGVWVYRRSGSHLPHAGQPCARPVFTGHDGKLQLFDELQVNGPVGCDVPLHALVSLCHCINRLIQ